MISLGIDCGTQSTKTLALDWETGKILASAHQPYEFIPNLPPGSMEQHPQDWIAAAESTVLSVLEQLGSLKERVKSIGISGQQHGLVTLDAQGNVVRPAKLWCDSSTVFQCAEITEYFGGTDRLFALLGTANMLPAYTAPKILWLRENEPENWKKTRTVLLPHDYLNFWLTGEFGMEYGDASGTAFMDVRSRKWCRPVCDFIAPDLIDKLPRLHSSLQPAGILRKELGSRWGLPEMPIVSSGGGDNMMSAIGTGNLHAGCVTASLGTSGTLFAYSEKPVLDPQGEVAAFCDSTDAWLPLICTMNVTLVTERIRTLFQWSYDLYDENAASIPAGAEGLLLLPYLNGERTPNLPHASGVLHGITIQNLTKGHLARAAVEGVIIGLGYGLKRFRELGIAPTEIRLTGGGSKSALWRHICAAVFKTSVVCLQNSEGAGLGAAIQAGWSADSSSSLKEIVNRFVHPDESTRAHPTEKECGRYENLLEKSCQLRKLLCQGQFL